ncbi:hypothetical protein BpHYR1_029610 [Brachionus plicatilis]|uniref:Uncharacterized protein n=1 Tax=Brachionus plicatilis TaxID=10195 RepID=A0A3M7RQ91_BRAPC|nr:hypothetical protein BpHYR1_029610 [Brachionus plicatilis]
MVHWLFQGLPVRSHLKRLNKAFTISKSYKIRLVESPFNTPSFLENPYMESHEHIEIRLLNIKKKN